MCFKIQSIPPWRGMFKVDPSMNKGRNSLASPMNQGVSLSMQRLIRRRLSKALGGQVQLVSAQQGLGIANLSGFCVRAGELLHFRFIRAGKELQLKPQLQFQRWERRPLAC